jgi:hypothetical protein
MVLMVSTAAWAAENPKVLEKAAKRACATGDFRKGVDLLAQLFVETDNLTYVFNQGRCYEQNHQWVSAIDRFREYLRKIPSAQTAERETVEKHITDCERFRDREEMAQTIVPPTTAPPPAVENQVAASRVVAPASPTGISTPAPPLQPEPASHISPLRVTGIVLGSTGIASAIVGLVLNLKANELATDYGKTRDPATSTRYDSYKLGSMVGYGAGAAMFAIGVGLYLFGGPAVAEGEKSVSLLPSWSPGHFSLALQRSF